MSDEWEKAERRKQKGKKEKAGKRKRKGAKGIEKKGNKVYKSSFASLLTLRLSVKPSISKLSITN
jgi:hypothetical protein